MHERTPTHEGTRAHPRAQSDHILPSVIRLQHDTVPPASTGRAAALLHGLRAAAAASTGRRAPDGGGDAGGMDPGDLACLRACAATDGPGPVALMRELAERQVGCMTASIAWSTGPCSGPTPRRRGDDACAIDLSETMLALWKRRRLFEKETMLALWKRRRCFEEGTMLALPLLIVIGTI